MIVAIRRSVLPRLFCWALVGLGGFAIGVYVNHRGWLLESIRVEVRLTTDGNTTDPRGPGNHSLGAPPSNETEDQVVPNIVHFIWFAPDSRKRMSFLNYISIKSAHVIQQPERILLHCNALPSGEWWERLVREVPLTLVYRAPPGEIHGQAISNDFHRGDIAKMEILLQYGGVYLDYDVILVNNLNPLRKYDMTLGKEKPPKFIFGIVVARKGALFLRLLYESYRDNYRPRDWDYNCARVAYALYLARPDLVHVEPHRFTTPDWTERHLLWQNSIDWRHLYLIHFMGHEDRTEYTPEIVVRTNTTLAQVVKFIYYGNPYVIKT